MMKRITLIFMVLLLASTTKFVYSGIKEKNPPVGLQGVRTQIMIGASQSECGFEILFLNSVGNVQVEVTDSKGLVVYQTSVNASAGDVEYVDNCLAGEYYTVKVTRTDGSMLYQTTVSID